MANSEFLKIVELFIYRFIKLTKNFTSSGCRRGHFQHLLSIHSSECILPPLPATAALPVNTYSLPSVDRS